jgi:hypothetical protein
VRRSRTRIDPCFPAARTHAPVRRCSSLIEISFMCHIAHTSLVPSASHGPPFEKPLAVPRSCCGRGHSFLRGRCFGASRDEVATGRTRRCQPARVGAAEVGHVERPSTIAAIGGVRADRPLAGPRRELHAGGTGKPAVSQSQSQHTLLHTKNSLIAS